MCLCEKEKVCVHLRFISSECKKAYSVEKDGHKTHSKRMTLRKSKTPCQCECHRLRWEKYGALAHKCYKNIIWMANNCTDFKLKSTILYRIVIVEIRKVAGFCAKCRYKRFCV